ncbi:preprotein translocase subunit SecE [Terricaulis sp.]|uniref:preprotein translocase subunit SecE n=1 Tax=Terricaulis sp. TaxID=2768686 RepID=UPI0037847478
MDTADQETEPKRRGGPMQFFREVQSEAKKVTWATRQEVTVSTVMVLIMGAVAAIFFFTVDTILRLTIGFLLSIGT